MQTKLIAILASAALTAASPLEARSAVGSEGFIATDAGVAVGGALDPTPRPTPSGFVLADAPAFLTIQVTNSHTAPVSTSHALASGSPAPVSGNVGPGVLAVGASDFFVAPPNWDGNIAIVDSSFAITGDDSLIEANYDGSIADVDVSYVDGFSVPITCSCAGTVVTGCNLDLFSLSSCPNPDGQGACVNPLRADMAATSATPFFAPCSGAAYTFPCDGGANSLNQCQNGVISCCVGTACPANPKQPN